VSYEVSAPVSERYAERTVREWGWVSKFRVTESVVRVIVTKVTTELVSPEGHVLSSYSINTRYVETEYVADRHTAFLGLTRIAGPQPGQPAPQPSPQIPAPSPPPSRPGVPSLPEQPLPWQPTPPRRNVRIPA
jgi:hypothetical protein